jgi:hypothetical protein
MKRLLSETVDSMGEAIGRFPWNDSVAYGDWLAQTYFYVRHSTRLLAAAAGRFGHDPRGNALHHRFGQHIGEEDRHELLALHDLKNLERGSVETYGELPSTRSFYEVQYSKIAMQNPLALFGYILPLEVTVAQHGRACYEKVRAAHGAKCASFFKVHVEDDPDHVEKAMAALEGLSEAEETMIRQSIEQTGFLYCSIIRQILERSTASKSAVVPPRPIVTASS